MVRRFVSPPMDEADDSDARDGVDTTVGDDAPGGVETVRTRPCPYCGASMDHRHCKYVCPEHGVVMDCADTFFHR